MSSYRDDLKAARSRISHLETELEERESEIDALLGPDAADARRRAMQGRRGRDDDELPYREARTLEEIRAEEERHHTRTQRLACLSISLGILLFAAGTFYLVYRLMVYAAG
ncbi:MAG: hypothetical protein JRI23_34555 [Deltaproteobacteria bacterium]|jgi:hypothetical protein|nr:hypothetical protein [Deltaproteobacteria bacterium]MBW2537421.1 hypothetical protein [Deltaproteobacteria bacterium]